MSENQVEQPSGEAEEINTINNVEEVKSENVITTQKDAQEEVDDDLEDGEIDDDDDNDVPVVNTETKIVTPAPPAPMRMASITPNKAIPSLPAQNMVSVMDIMNEPVKKSKSKKRHADDDDFAGSVESAIAAALKRDGIMPPRPKILDSRDDMDKQSDKEAMFTKSSRRRKRKKMRDEREKAREKKKRRASSPDTHLSTSVRPIDEDLDDDEMLCVRGGSPPPAALMPTYPPHDLGVTAKKEGYDSDDSYSSYDSYDSLQNYIRYRKKDGSSRSKRKERRRDDERRAEKRSRRNYDDSGGDDKYQDRHPQQPRKLELCKFYLMECCAKKDKCSYMHSEFPCKYYYLGMECVYRSACKFSHGKPLTDQLRSVLLKHLETAPKEILGTFRRISRENALIALNATHEKICEEHGVENTLAQPTMTTQSLTQSQACGMRNGNLSPQQHMQQHQYHHHHHHQKDQQHQEQQQHHQNQQLQQQPQQPQQQPQQPQQSQQSMQSEIIPSLLDMVIKIPPVSSETSTTSCTTAGTVATGGAGSNQNKSDKQRKSRWCDSSAANPVAHNMQNNLEPPSSSAPSYLDLKNLTGILSADRIEKLSQFGVVNLEQINQFTLNQLNSIGLTVAEMSEIQLNAMNMARLGVAGGHSDAVTTNISNTSTTVSSPGSLCLPLTTTTTITTSAVTSEKATNDLVLTSTESKPIPTGMVGITPATGASLNDSGSSSGISGIDYSQYLRDSNLGYDKNDLLDDEKDDEQLVIDDQELDDGLDDNFQSNEPEIKEKPQIDSKVSTPFTYGGSDISESRLPPTIQLSDNLQNLLKDPAKPYTVNVSALMKSADTSNISQLKSDSIQTPSYSDDTFYGAGAGASNNHRDTDTRGEYRNPRLSDPRDEYRDSRHSDDYRDPRLTTRSIEQRRPSFSYRPNDSGSDSDRTRSPSPVLSVAQQMENFVSLYERQSMYDWTPKCIQEDLEYSKRNLKADKDMRLAGFRDSSNSDIDLRQPFNSAKSIKAKEIDASMSTLSPMPYKIKEIDVPDPKYSDLRHSFQCDDSTDPRLRRVFGLPELSNSRALVGLGRQSRPTIASPSSAESSSSPTRERSDRVRPSASVVRGPRVDPRRAAATSTVTSSGAAHSPPISASNPHQNVEIRMLLQKSDWYKNLNSKYKIMVNQQLALVSTELKRFHQDPSPNKVFDMQIIVSNQNLQQILTNLGVYIDDNGQVAQLENENEMMGGGMDYGPGTSGNQMLNMGMQQNMAMQHQLDFLRGPPPNMNMIGLNGPMGPGVPGQQQGMFGGPGGMMPQYGRNARLGILGMPPGAGGGGGGGFNPFGGNPADNGGGGGMMEPNYCGPNNNPFANNFGINGGNFGGQQMNRGNRNNFNRPGGGSGGGMNNGGNRMNQNRRPFKQNRRGGGGNSGPIPGPSSGASGNLTAGNAGPSGGPASVNADEEEESWDNDV